jgi:spermidine synthase
MLRAALALIGFTAVIAQVLLMRELLVVFYGNELTLGVMLAAWLFWTAVGAGTLGRWTMRARHPQKLVAGLEVMLALALPATVLAVRASKVYCQSVPGEILGPLPMIATSAVTLSVFCAISGALFAAGSGLWAETSGAAIATATGAVYLLEAAGSGIGGLLASLVLVRLANPFAVTAFLGALNLAAAWTLLAPGSKRRWAWTAILGALAAIVVAGGFVLQPVSLAWVWRGFKLVGTRNSVYGSLAVVETGESRSLFENGLIVSTVPDAAAAEEAVHYALLEHSAPRRVLLIGGGINGSVAEALAHPTVERVDYVELDPAIFDLAARYFPNKTLLDPRVRTMAMDGRRFLASTAESFDVIIVNLPDPHTAQLNRFYTEEFYRRAAARLRAGGILSFQVTASENYISQEQADFLRCLERTLRQVFPEVVAIPGETVHFFAAAKPGTLTADPHELLRRLRARHLHTQYVREYFLPFRMSPDRMADLHQQIEPMPMTPVNRDFAPVAYYFDAVLWSARFRQTSGQWWQALARISFRMLMGIVTLVLAALVPILWWWPDRRQHQPAARARRAAAWAVAASGFAGLGLEMLLLLGFQALYGYIYHELTVLVALFMAGMALGGWWALRLEPKPESVVAGRDLRLLAVVQLLLAAAPLALYGLFLQLERASGLTGQHAGSDILFPVLAVVAGGLGGFQFLLASQIYFAGRQVASGEMTPGGARSPGVLYALDLFGACAGAMALSILLIPVYGYLRTAVLMAAVSLAPAAMAVAARHGGAKGR